MKAFITFRVLLFLTTSSLLMLCQRAEKIHKHLEDIFELTNINSASYITMGDPEDRNDLKYILLWTDPLSVPFAYMGEGQKGFIANGCQYTNCYSTGNRSLLNDLTKFDLVVFNGPQILSLKKDTLPKIRSPHQKYVFASIESSGNYPLCDERFDGFFNWTWTYKLNSDARWGYIVIKDKEQTIIGPNVDMHWMKREDMNPLSKELKYQLKSKTRAAVWFVSNCITGSRREKYVRHLLMELKSYHLNVDIYGKCGKLKCEQENECAEMVKKKYYFYLAFENSFADDYVTEKLLHALQNDAVPIVYGGANYTRFMPDGMYLNARELGAKELAKKMNDLIYSPAEYAKYFRWKNHYSFNTRTQDAEENDYCVFCAMLNNKRLTKKKTVYGDFTNWWMGHHNCRPNIFLFNLDKIRECHLGIPISRNNEVLNNFCKINLAHKISILRLQSIIFP